MEISYRFSKIGTDAYDIIDEVDIFGPLKLCNKSAVILMSETVLDMMNTGVIALRSLDNSLSGKIYEKENIVDMLYRKSLRDFTKVVNFNNGYPDK